MCDSEEAFGDDQSDASNVDRVNLLGGAVGDGVQKGGACDLDALNDCDLFAEGDLAVAARWAAELIAL